MAGKQVLIVEGPNDEHVVKNICGIRKLGKIEHICPYNGKDKLLEAIGVRLKESDISSLGILLDADTDLKACWGAIAHRLLIAGYFIPADPNPEGTVLDPPPQTLLPKVGIWLMPDNKVPGILEDFLRFLVPENDPLLAHVEKSINDIPGQPRFTDLKRPKALIHTWLAWQEEPGKPLGQAISAKYFDPQLPLGELFANWLKRTFSL